MQVGPRTTNRKSSLTSLAAGLEGTVGTIDWDVNVGQGTSKISNNDSNYLNTELFFAALEDGSIDASSLNNPKATLDALRLTPKREGKSVVRYVNAKMSGQLMELKGGPMQYAVGFSSNREKLTDTPDADQLAGNVFGSIQQAAVDAKRNSSAFFGELSIPIFKGLETQVALRHDRYPGNSKTSPKFAAKYSPFGGLAVRASYAESFLAPTLKQLYGGQDEGAESTEDPDICAAFPTLSGPCSNFAYKEVSGSNPNLRPETGKTINIGVVFEPVANVGISVDAWQIKKKDEISTLSTLSAIANGDIGIVNGEAIVYVYNQNVAATKVNGIDLDIRGRVGDTPFGRMSIRDTATYYMAQKTQFEPGDVFYEYLGTFLSPRWRNSLAVNFEQGPWSTTFTLRTTASMKDTTLPTGFSGNRTARRIDAHEELDVGFSYTGVKNLTFNGIVKNVLDSAPPYANNGTLNQYGSLGFPWIYSPRGRYFSFSANYKFF
jgi:iron complex outermembrane receptor protein